MVHPQVNGAGPNQGPMTRSQILANLNESVWMLIGELHWSWSFPYLVTDAIPRLIDRIARRPRRCYRSVSAGLEAQSMVYRLDERHFSYLAGT
jgi:hypothetical protein